MLLSRKIYQNLLEWKSSSNGKKALLIEGARRIGKSTIVEAFAQNEYRSYLLIDFSKTNNIVQQAFELYLDDLDTFFMILSTQFNVTLYPRESLIIFDEIQFFPKARQAIKHLVSDGRYDYIETGSLISIRENVQDILIPSEERHIRMYPLDFEEFCVALGNEQMLAYIRECFEKKQPLLDDLHHKAMLLFRQYIVVGGMPQSILAYIENNRSFTAADAEKRDILSLYRSDLRKADLRYQTRITSVFNQIPSFLSGHEKRIRFSHLEGKSSYPAYQDAFFWLQDSMMVNECFNCNDPNVGLSVNEDRSFVKCYMGDTGLLISHAFTEAEVSDGKLYQQLINHDLSVNEGMFFENAIAQCLTSQGYPLFFYTRYNKEKHRNDIEIDFIISNKSKINPKIYPIEVKSSKRYTTKSLDRFTDLFKKRIGQNYVIHTKNLQVNGETLCIPAYMTFCL